MPEVPRVSVIILAMDFGSGLAECLASLEKAVYPQFEAVVVFNGPRSEELEKRAAACRKVSEVIFTGSNAGFPAGNNAGIRRALERGADYVYLLNDDTEVAPDFLDGLVALAESDAGLGMAGSEVLCFYDRERVSFRGAKFVPECCEFIFPGADRPSPGVAAGAFESDFITGCALLVKRAVLEKVGLLDERFFIYWEDSDWSFRARAAGFRCFVVPASRIWHKVSSAFGGTQSCFKAYHKTRSHFIFASAHAPDAVPGIFLKALRDIAWLILKSGEKERLSKARAYASGAVAYMTGRTGAGPRWLTEKRW